MTPEERAALRRIDLQFEAVRAMPRPIPSAERYRHSIEEVAEGGYIRVAGQIHRVVELSHYQQTKSRFHELELLGLTSGEMRYIEWEKDDAVEVCFNQPPISLRELGLSADDIEEMSDEEEGTIGHDGKTYHYDDDYKAVYHRSGGGEGEPVYMYDFETADERWCLTVEEWGDEEEGYEYEVYISEYLDPNVVEVLVVGPAHEG